MQEWTIPNSLETFTIETDASGLGIGAVLQQEGHPIAFLSKTLAPKHQAIFAYEKEFLAVLMALLTTPFQAKWLPKLLGFDYEISYKSGMENVVADALLRVLSGVELNALILTYITTDLLQQVKFSWKDSDIGGSAQAKQVCSFHCYATPLHCKHNCTSLLGQCVQLHGSPDSIVSDKDKIFLSHFWQSLFKVLKVQLKMSTAYHPQTDGQTEIVNNCLESFLRCMNGEKPKEWVVWLPMAEFWYNINFHSTINTTPFETIYGQTPPPHIPYINGDSVVEIVDRTM
ncbi:reverse transcriptase [Tanacetum coccineum]